MYQDIGLRNHQAVMRQGHKLVEKLKENETTRPIAYSIDDRLKQIDLLFHAANILVNR